ncbi:MAG: FHA domain-containing protein [Chloroflexota bacterium]|nr:FHA domain-containing protein [Chloroflexota bacterium]
MISFDVFVFILNAAFVLLLYLFLFEVVRVILRELRTVATQAPSESPYGKLVVVQPGTTGISPGFVLPLEPTTAIGRKLTNAVVLDDATVSGEHAILYLRDGAWYVRDAGSTNGTLVNGQDVVAPSPIRVGDVLTMGNVQLRLSR